MIDHVKQFFLKGEVIMQTNYENLLRESPEYLTLEGLNEWIIQLRDGLYINLWKKYCKSHIA